MKLLAKTILTFLSVGLSAVSAQDVTPCSTDMDAFCERESNRFCFMTAESEGEIKDVCGNCLPGFVEWRVRCVSEDQVDILLFLEEYAPEFLEPKSNAERTELLLKALQFIASYQEQNPPPAFELGVNAFSADTALELRSRLGFDPVAAAADENVNIKSVPTFQSANLPVKVDWVEQGAVTSVKDQGYCGCCWAVSVAGVIEGTAAIQNNFLQSLSFQQFISCDDNNFGCNGGSLVYALAYSIGSSIAGANDYPFTDKKGSTTNKCNTGAPAALDVAEASYVVDFYDDFTFEERKTRMKEAVAKQPVAMVLKSGCQLFSSYKRGILTADDGCTCNEPVCADHAVLMVGYDDTSDPPSWKIKNSWGTGWGENGYVRIAQTQKGDYGLFGVLTHGVVPDMTFNLTEGSSVTESTGLQQAEEETTLEWWAWLLILLAACCLIFSFASWFLGCLCPRRK
jgi:hypothetical protein